MSMFSCHLLLDHFQFTLTYVSNTPGSYAILFFTASDFTFISRHIHNYVLIPLSSNHFIPSAAVSSCSPLFPTSISDTFQPEGLIFQCCIFLSFYIQFMRFLQQVYWGGLPLSPPSFVSILCYDLSVLGGPTQHGS